MLIQTKKLLLIATGLLTSLSLTAGGFFIELGKASANPEAQAKHAILVVRSVGCVAPEKTTLTAAAEGLFNGKRESIALKLLPLASQGAYALTRQWPADGKWVISLVAANPNAGWQPSALVRVDGDAVDWANVTRLSHAPDSHEIEAALNTTVAAKLH